MVTTLQQHFQVAVRWLYNILMDGFRSEATDADAGGSITYTSGQQKQLQIPPLYEETLVEMLRRTFDDVIRLIQ